MKFERREIEVLTFRRHGQIATVVTDGSAHRTYEPTACKSHRSMTRAISYLEANGYEIEMDTFNGD